MKQRLTNKTEHETETQHEVQGEQSHAAKEFASVEELLRHDAANTAVPDRLRERVLQSISAEPVSTPWWRRWLK